MRKEIEKGQTSNCNQSNTPLQYKGKNKRLQHLKKGLAETASEADNYLLSNKKRLK